MVCKDFLDQLFFLVYTVEVRRRANTHNIQQEEQETRGAGEGRTKQCGTETFGDLWKGEGWGGVHKENKMDTTRTFRSLQSRDFQEGKQGI